MILGSPVHLGNTVLRNRIVSAPMERNYCNSDGSITPRYIDYLAQRAAGGTALVYTEATYVRQDGKSRPNQMGISDDSHIPGLSELARRVHDEGGLLGVQLMHGGRTSSRRTAGVSPVAPSVVPLQRPNADMPFELTIESIEDLVRSFGRAAERARESGFDVISIHGAHGYLVHSFMSSLTNLRTDRYGDRSLFVREVLDAVLEGAGDVPVGIRLSAFEGNPGGFTAEEQLERFAGLNPERLSFVDISAGNYEAPHWMMQSGEVPRGVLAPYAEPYRRFGIPVGVAGRINNPETAEQILAAGQADYVTVGRALHADPGAAGHWLRDERYRPCIACNLCADDLGAGAVRCSVNAWAGGGKPVLWPTVRPTKVLVVGAGPAGLESARLLAENGFEVEVVDANDTIGGQFRLASTLKVVPEYHRILDWYRDLLPELGVTVTLGTRLDAAAVRARGADAVLLATGARGIDPHLPGGHLPHVSEIRDWLATLDEFPAHATIIGGDREALAVAYHLGSGGSTVTIIAEEQEIGAEVGMRAKTSSAPFIATSPNVTVHTRTSVLAITPDAVVVLSEDGNERSIPASGPVLTTLGTERADELVRELSDTDVTVFDVSEDGRPCGTFLSAITAAGLAAKRVSDTFSRSLSVA